MARLSHAAWSLVLGLGLALTGSLEASAQVGVGGAGGAGGAGGGGGGGGGGGAGSAGTNSVIIDPSQIGNVGTPTIFCPGRVAVGSGFGFGQSNGLCTNNETGAFSGAALGSQSLSDLTQASTQETTRAAVSAVATRREEEQQRCPEGLVRVGGSCQRPTVDRGDPQLPPRTRVDVRRPAPRARVAAPAPGEPGYGEKRPGYFPPVYAPVLPQPGARFGAFIRGFGDYEERTGRSTSTIGGVTSFNVQPTASGIPAITTNGGIIPYSITARSEADTIGFVGGLDLTTRDILTSGDGFIFGVLGGYMSNNIDVRVNTTTSNPAVIGSGSSRLRARLDGPSVGAFLTYFQGPFSADLTYKADILDLRETFVDNKAFVQGVNFTLGVPLLPTNVITTGTGSTSLVTHSVAGNWNYRIPVTDTVWIEPTTGFTTSWTEYDRSAAALGLDDGYFVRLQGGARLGADWWYGSVRVTPVVTGLVYSDVLVRGGFVPSTAGTGFGATTIPGLGGGTTVINLRQERLVRGQGIFALNVDFGNGFSSFIQGDVRGGKDLFGAGGRAGVRYQW